MPAPLVVHLGLAPERARSFGASASPDARHVTGGSAARADVVVLHGRAGRRAPRWRSRPVLVVRRPGVGARPGLLDRRALAWTDLVVVHAHQEVAAWRGALGGDGRRVAVLATDDAPGWRELVARAVDPAGLAAQRWIGDDLLVAPADPTGAVERLTGSGPAIWALLQAGRTPDEVADELRLDDPGARASVAAFVAHLAARGLAVPA